jgi:hypothetical protein
MTVSISRAIALLAMTGWAGSAAAQTCAAIPTHYNNQLHGFEAGANNLYNEAPAPGLRYPANRLPKYESYVGTNFTTTQFTGAEVCAWTQQITALTGYPVYVLQPTSYTDVDIAKSVLASNSPGFQVLPNLIVGNSLVTIIVPPGWTPTGKYPIVANGMYDIKGAMQSEAPVILSAIADAMRVNQSYRAITVIWNGRGESGSRTADGASMFDFSLSILMRSEKFGGDRNRLFVEGVSRGGLTALRIASRVRTLAVFAAVSPAALGDVATMTNATVPALYDAAEWSIGINSPWKANWTYPSPPGYPEMVGLSQTQAHLKILTGQSEPLQVNASDASPKSTLGALRNNGTSVFLQVGSHDNIVPWLDQYRYLNAMKTSGVKFEAVVNYLSGHYRDGALFRQKIGDALVRSYQGLPLIVSPGSIARRILSNGTFVDAGTSDLFTIELPKLMSPSIAGSLNASGVPGTEFRISYTPPGQPQQTYQDTLGSDGTRFLPFALPVGTTRVDDVRFRLPGASQWRCKVLDRSSTGTPNRTLEVVAEDPAWTGGQLTGELTKRITGDGGAYARSCPGWPNATGLCSGVSWGFIQAPVSDGSDACVN